ncbi:hypothetical protein CHS0354_014337 [Potamilus streckersoni]|uniref:Uncharacterized protein n=1 Tax=Potamilus streckersoni TaxID=2493646 RepID=A0AAE0SL99_9BIVA|nr:hypothetical protein CHS0354_014337 [Potamilus streckersoni]
MQDDQPFKDVTSRSDTTGSSNHDGVMAQVTKKLMLRARLELLVKAMEDLRIEPLAQRSSKHRHKQPVSAPRSFLASGRKNGPHVSVPKNRLDTLVPPIKQGNVPADKDDVPLQMMVKTTAKLRIN